MTEKELHENLKRTIDEKLLAFILSEATPHKRLARLVNNGRYCL